MAYQTLKDFVKERLKEEPEQCKTCDRRKACIPSPKERRQNENFRMPLWCSAWEEGGLAGYAKMLGDGAPPPEPEPEVKRPKRGETPAGQGSLL